MKDYATKLADNEKAINRWLTRLTRATNKIEKLRKQRVAMLRAQSKALNKEADTTEKAVPITPKPLKRGKPDRRINL